MTHYVKLFGSILTSSIWQEPDHVFRVWIAMLALKDVDGIVEASIPGLANVARRSIVETEDALETLLAPDPYSSTPDFEGRRIVAVPGGWKVLNHEKYRDKMDVEEQRSKKAARQAKWREAQRDAERRGVDGPASTVDAPRRGETRGDALLQKVSHTDPDTDPEPGAGSAEPRFPDPESGSPVPPAAPKPPVPPPVGTPTKGYPPVTGRKHSAGAAGESSVAGVLERQPVAAEPVAPTHARTIPPGPPGMWHQPEPDSPETKARRELGEWGWKELNAIRQRVAAKHRWRDVRALHPMDPGRTELAARLRESGASGGESLRHVLAVAEADAISRGTVEYLTGSVFDPVPWRKKLAMRVEDAGRRDRARDGTTERAGAREALARERADADARRPVFADDVVTISPEEREEARLELARLRETFGIPRASDATPGVTPDDAGDTEEPERPDGA